MMFHDVKFSVTHWSISYDSFIISSQGDHIIEHTNDKMLVDTLS